MCGRYTLAATVAQVAMRFGATVGPAAGAAGAAERVGQSEALADLDGPRFNLAPGQLHPVVVPQGAGRQLTAMTWGLVPRWAREPSARYSTINARAETVAEKPTYRGPLRQGRCLVPASGFYEWQGSGKSKQPYYMQVVGDDGPGALFAFAGLYDCWHGPDGAALWSYTIITTTANDRLTPIHARMPVILPPAAEAAWLDPQAGEAAWLDLLRPYAPAAITAHPVATLVNRPTCDGPDLIQPWTAAGVV
ncbi:MAG: SOS response-associated peptidase [Chloroflexota bacterium]|nr:SOS response-associated peptidase [Chloroflexota bacterium]